MRNPSTVLMELVFNTRGRGVRKGPAGKGEKTKWFCPVRSRLPFTGIAFAENLLLVRGLELKAVAQVHGQRLEEKILPPAIPFATNLRRDAVRRRNRGTLPLKNKLAIELCILVADRCKINNNTMLAEINVQVVDTKLAIERQTLTTTAARVALYKMWLPYWWK